MLDMEKTKELQKAMQKRNFYTIKDSGRVYLYALILPLLVGLIFSYMALAIASGNGIEFPEGSNIINEMFENYLWFSIPFVMLTQIVFACIFFGYNKFNRIQNRACSISFKKANIWTVLLCVLVGIVCVLGFVWLVEGCFGEFFKVLGLPSSSLHLPLDTVGWYFLSVLLLGILPAICEELLFRGIVFKGLKEKFGPIASILLCGLVFALMHQSIQQFIYPFILGCVLCVVMQRTNNLIYPILIHLFNNITTITLQFLVNIKVIDLSFNVSWWGVLLAILIASLTFVGLFLLDKFYLGKHTKLDEEKTGVVVQTPAVSVGKFPLTIVCGIVFSVVLIVINALG